MTQSKLMSWVECIVKTFVTGLGAVLANYFLLPVFWNLPPTLWDSVTMAIWFAGQSIILSYPIRRFFNGLGV